MRFVLLSLSLIVFMFTGCSNRNLEQGNAQAVSNINQIDDSDDLALHDAIRAKDIDSAKQMINAQVHINAQDTSGYTPLHLTAVYNQPEIAQLLIDNKAVVNSEDKYGDTPLIDASRNNYFKVARLLVCNNAQRGAQDRNGQTPLHYASQAKNADMVELLLSSKLDVFCQNALSIALNTLEDTTNTTPEICGIFKEGVASSVDVVIGTELQEEPLQTLKASINEDESRWCAAVTEALALGSYTIKATAKDKADHVSEVSGTLNIVEAIAVQEVAVATLSSEIYAAVNEALGSDLEALDITFTQDLLFTFNNEKTHFTRDSSIVTDIYKEQLDAFFPKLIPVLQPYEGKIKFLVQGHTSSVFESSSDEKVKFMKNEILSHKRAKNVLEHIKANQDERVVNAQPFIQNDFSAVAKSSLETIKNDDMSENYAKSRRVDFKIEVLDENATLPSEVQNIPATTESEPISGIEELELLQ